MYSIILMIFINFGSNEDNNDSHLEEYLSGDISGSY